MSNKNQKILTFFRKNAYYFIFLLCLGALVTAAVIFIVSSNEKQLDNTPTIEQPDEPSTPNVPDEPSEPTTPSEPNEPTVTVVVFDLPVQGTIIKEYVAASVVYNQTLNLYTGHKAIDFGAEEGANVYACYDGKVDSITESKLDGITITVDHGNGLKSHYNSIEVDESITVGSEVKKGDVLGYVSTNNRTEYKDGAHLHFTVTENGEKINPEKYLLIEEK